MGRTEKHLYKYNSTLKNNPEYIMTFYQESLENFRHVKGSLTEVSVPLYLSPVVFSPPPIFFLSLHLITVNLKWHFMFESIPEDNIHLVSFNMFSFDSIFSSSGFLTLQWPWIQRVLGPPSKLSIWKITSIIWRCFLKLIYLSSYNKTKFPSTLEYKKHHTVR